MTVVILNGTMTDEDAATVPVNDRGFLYGESVFTTIRCYGGKPAMLDRHAARMNQTLEMLAIKYQVNAERLACDISLLVENNRLTNAVARYEITAGCGGGPSRPASAKPNTLLTLKPLPDVPASASLMITSIRRDAAGVFARHKLGSYIESLAARREALSAGATDGVITDLDGNLLETATANIFAVVNGTILTPPVSDNLLPGIARETFLCCATTLGLPADEQRLTPEIAGSADEFFYTNCVVEAMPVQRIGEREIPAPGPITIALQNEYRRIIEL